MMPLMPLIVLSRLEMLDWEVLPDGTKPYASSLLMTRLTSGRVAFSAADPKAESSRLEGVPEVLVAGKKPCCSSKLITRGMLGTDRFSISESRLRALRLDFVAFASGVTFALGRKPASSRLTMYVSMRAVMELVSRLFITGFKVEGSFLRAINDAKLAA